MLINVSTQKLNRLIQLKVTLNYMLTSHVKVALSCTIEIGRITLLVQFTTAFENITAFRIIIVYTESIT